MASCTTAWPGAGVTVIGSLPGLMWGGGGGVKGGDEGGLDGPTNIHPASLVGIGCEGGAVMKKKTQECPIHPTMAVGG